MKPGMLVGTEKGLWRLHGDALEPVETLAARAITALARDGAQRWALVEGRALWVARDGGEWREHASIDGPDATCLAPTRDGLLVGTDQAHLLRLANGRLSPVGTFDTAEGRDRWYTPWGDPAAVRSIAVATDGTLHVNVHVGGVVRSRDGGRSWAPTVDIEVDVHQILAHPTRAGVVLAAAYEGLGISVDGGDSWRFVTEGMHAHYCRAVALSDDTVIVSASTGPGGRRAGLYRRPLDREVPLERSHHRLPWFNDNIDTACLQARGPLVVFGTEDGRVFRSRDGGEHWQLVGKSLPAVRCVSLG